MLEYYGMKMIQPSDLMHQCFHLLFVTLLCPFSLLMVLVLPLISICAIFHSCL